MYTVGYRVEKIAYIYGPFYTYEEANTFRYFVAIEQDNAWITTIIPVEEYQKG